MLRSLLVLSCLCGALAAQREPATPASPTAIPAGLPRTLPAPADNPLTEAAFALGRRLFFDPILSADRGVSCGSCHRPERAFGSVEPLPPGVHGRRALRHAPVLVNRGFGARQRWDGATATLEEQVLLPIEDPNEMGLPIDDAVARVAGDAGYSTAFVATFGSGVDRGTLSRALSSFVRGLLLGDSPVDRFVLGEREALTPAERAGLWIWESKGGCWRCHPRPHYTDEGFHATGVGARDGRPEDGRFVVTGDEADRGKFKTPTLRGVASSAPYMHDGSLATLEDVVAFYRKGGEPHSHRSPLLAPLELGEADAANLIAFLQALSRGATTEDVDDSRK